MEKKKIDNYDNYIIYDNGDVENTLTHKKLKGSISEHGYKYYRLSKDNNKHMFYAHRLVAEYFIDNPNDLPIVNHKDGNKLNNNVDNLEWITYSDNIAHAHHNNLIKPVSAPDYYIGDLEGEKWVNIPNYFNYQISSKGRVLNMNTKRLLKPSITCGYYKVRLSQDGQVSDFLIHKLMYSIFHNEPYQIDKEYIIDHIDGNKMNNDIDNLRKITMQENTFAALYDQKTNNCAKPVLQYSLKGELLNEFPSCKEAARQLHLDGSTISKVCRGVNKTHGGYIFRYK